MKNLIFIFCIISGLTLFSCEKSDLKEMTFVKDCTGEYLRWMEKDYHICNYEMVEEFANGEIVNASFDKLTECNNQRPVCELHHPNEGWIEVKKIERK